MSYPLYQKIVESKDITAVHGIHLLAKGILKSNGYQWELRRSGDMKLGYWKKVLKPRNSKSPYPKRFVLIPGFGDTPLSWYLVTTLLYPILKRNFDEILLVDFPGFGGFLSREKSFPSLDFMMGMVHDTLDSLKPHTILGHSLGGWLTANYAAHCGAGTRPISNKLNYSGPDTILLVNPSGIFQDQKAKKKCESIFKTTMSDGFHNLRPHLFTKEPIWFRLIAHHYSKFFAREDILQFMNSVGDKHSTEIIAHQIRAKIWLVWGEKDTLIPSNSALAWLKCLDPEHQDNQRAVILRGVGHSPQVETPTKTAAVLAQILMGKEPHQVGKRWWKVLAHRSSDEDYQITYQP